MRCTHLVGNAPSPPPLPFPFLHAFFTGTSGELEVDVSLDCCLAKFEATQQSTDPLGLLRRIARSPSFFGLPAVLLEGTRILLLSLSFFTFSLIENIYNT